MIHKVKFPSAPQHPKNMDMSLWKTTLMFDAISAIGAIVGASNKVDQPEPRILASTYIFNMLVSHSLRSYHDISPPDP